MGWQKNVRRRMARWLSQQGYEVQPNRMHAGRFPDLVVSPETVIDVGVGRGTPWLYEAFPDKNFLLIDPMPEAQEYVLAAYPHLRAKFFETALGEENGMAELKIPIWKGATHMPMASLLNRDDAHVEKISGWDTRLVPVTTLDELVGDDAGPFGLKLDAEGAEPAILRGASQVLQRCAFVVLELSLSHRFAETEAPSNVIASLAAVGLEMRDVLDTNGGSETAPPRHIDALFTRWSN